ncbi:MAG: TetR family transcriptional regulator [Burkholderiaceae bacterium]
MVRRTKSEAQATRDSLLDAAQQTFCRLGVAGTTLDEVARAAGVTRGAVYWHFSGKEELFKAMCDRSVLPLEEMLERVSREKHDDPLAALAKVTIEALRAIATTPRTREVMEILLHKCEAPSQSDDGMQPMQEADRECQASVERLILQAVTRGQVPKKTDATLAAHAVNAFVSGLVRQWVVDPSAFDLSDVAPDLVNMLMTGLRAAPPLRRTRATQRGNATPRSSAAIRRTYAANSGSSPRSSSGNR